MSRISHFSWCREAATIHLVVTALGYISFETLLEHFISWRVSHVRDTESAEVRS